MPDALFRISFAGPHVSFQDGGRFGHMRFGVPASGPMDRLSHATANIALGNRAGATAIEVSMGGLTLDCLAGPVSIAVAGGDFIVDHDGRKRSSWSIFPIHTGERLALRPGLSGSWAYIAFAGNIVAPSWLGHTATHSFSGFGGGTLIEGKEIEIKTANVIEEREGEISRPGFSQFDGNIRVVMGPQNRYFRDDAINTFLSSDYRLTDAYDRMGVRLSGAALDLADSLAIPSEPIVRGSVQVAGDGVPTVLLADHQTTGGYPKIATVISDDLDHLVQLRAHDQLRFKTITPEEAVTLARIKAGKRETYLAEIAIPRGNLAQRLMQQNLISGVVSALASNCS